MPSCHSVRFFMQTALVIWTSAHPTHFPIERSRKWTSRRPPVARTSIWGSDQSVMNSWVRDPIDASRSDHLSGIMSWKWTCHHFRSKLWNPPISKRSPHSRPSPSRLATTISILLWNKSIKTSCRRCGIGQKTTKTCRSTSKLAKSND